MTTYPFSDMFKSAFGLNQLFDTQRRNMEAFTAANQAIVEAARAISRRQAEAMRDGMQTMLKASREAFTAGSPEVTMSRQAEATREAMESTLNNIREVTEMVTKSSFEAFDVLNKRANESLQEISRAAGHSTSSSKKKAA